MKQELFNRLIESFHQAIAHAQGKLELRTTYLPRSPEKLGKDQIIELRRQLDCSQQVFAAALNVSLKSVQAWESGTKTPSGAALKLLTIVQRHPDVLFENR